MKRLKQSRRIIVYSFAGCLLVAACFAPARAQKQPPGGTVIPSVCVETARQSGAATLAADVVAGGSGIAVNGYVPPLSTVIINPGGATEEAAGYVFYNILGGDPYILDLRGDLISANGGPASKLFKLAYTHKAGEPVKFSLLKVDAYFGYNNTADYIAQINKGIPQNYFSPGAPTYPDQPTLFQPGVHERALKLTFAVDSSETMSWHLNGGVAVAGKNSTRCATITYQGRLSSGGAAASGNYDLRFTAFDAPTGGTAQTATVTTTNVPVTNGVFTTNLDLGGGFFNKESARYLEIAVRPSGANPDDPFTTLAPRQPVTDVPFAVNAQTALSANTAANADNATKAVNADKLGNVAADQYVLTTDPRLSSANNANFIQNTTLPQTANFNINGDGTIGGSLKANTITANSITGNGAGLTGILSVYSLTGSSVTAPANASGYTFIGQTQTLTLTAGQRLTGAGSVPLATSAGTNVVAVGLCYRIGDGDVTNFAVSSTNTIVDETYKIYAASATVVPGAGSVRVGLCVGKNSQPLLSNNANGWVMVTNN